jgi:hypothetical protein
MNIRTALFTLALTALAAPVARGQGAPQKTVVISEAALRAMSAAKQKTKKPLTARLAVKRQSSVIGSTKNSGHTEPATVSEITPVRRK